MLEYAVSEGIVDTDSREKIFGDDRPRMSAVSVLMKNSEIAAKKQQARLDQYKWKDKTMALRHVEHDGFGADCVIVTSASSKTSIALAHCLARRGGARVIGLTSAANQEFVRKLGLYDEIVRYDAADSLPSEGRAVLVDMAGNAAVR